MGMPRHNQGQGALATLLMAAVASVGDPLPGQRRSLQRLAELRNRLTTERFQLAVLGQLKRGKSTLLNALLGARVLPTAVVPLTAIPTFVEAGKNPCVRSIFLSGAHEDFCAGRPEGLAERLVQLVTEENNPNNMLGLSQVEVMLPGPLLDRGVILIDTPGVGSTYKHNTERAEAVLPECDAALFVVSPDPPITEVEIGYLAQIKATVARLIIVLNKVDTVDPDDLATAERFLRRMLAERAGVEDTVPVFAISARAALRAKISGDEAALMSSGLPRLEAHLGDFLTRGKRQALEDAITRKAVAIGDRLLMETEMRLQALRLPIEDLDARIAMFDDAMIRLNGERRILHDLLQGDRRRALELIEADAEKLRQSARRALEAEGDRALAGSNRVEAAREALAAMVAQYFEPELGRAFAEVRQRLSAALDDHRRRIDELIGQVRQTAATIMNVPFRSMDSAEDFEFRREPYWVTSGRIETLAPFGPGTLDRLLPRSLRKERTRRRLRQEIDTIVQRNIENLRWAMRQNVEDAFRQFDGALEEVLVETMEATRGAIVLARDRRRADADRAEAEIGAVRASADKLRDVLSALRRVADALARG